MQNQLPSLYYVKCQKCGANDYRILGTKGSIGKTAGAAVFGAVGALVADATNKDTVEYKPLRFKCSACGNKFESLPLTAQQEELLSAPCTISFTRLGSFVGMAVQQTIWLNGIAVARIGNKQPIQLSTLLRYNTLFVTDQTGLAFKGHYSFEAAPNGSVQVNFKRKFV